MFCSNCGRDCTGNKKFCPQCGYNLMEDSDNLQVQEIAVAPLSASIPPLQKPKKKSKAWIVVIIVFVWFGGMMAIYQQLSTPEGTSATQAKSNTNISNNQSSSVISSEIESEKRLTLEKYNSIQNGMTYGEVMNIIGFEGTREAELGEPDSELHTFSIRYMGNNEVTGTLGANASFMFQGGKLQMKAQIGLK